jgi:nickel/cobalt transporter (NicO) family protein
MGLYLVWSAIRPHTEHKHEGHSPDHHDHHHVHDEHCGHAHVAEAKQVRGDWSFTKAFSLAFAVGIRPCTGALLVLVLANALGIYWAGVASTFVMAIGTFITVSAIAAIAVYSKKLATRLAARDDKWLGRLAFTLRLGGGVAIAGLGGLLFLGSLGRSTGMM